MSFTGVLGARAERRNSCAFHYDAGERPRLSSLCPSSHETNYPEVRCAEQPRKKGSLCQAPQSVEMRVWRHPLALARLPLI